jgi:putative ABC transport system substrate-binding protein
LYSRILQGADDLAASFDDAGRRGAQAVILMTRQPDVRPPQGSCERGARHHLPSIHSFPPEARDGGLMAFGPADKENYGRAAAVADQILKGARPADLPVGAPPPLTLC